MTVLKTQTVIDLTVDVGKWDGPLTLEDTPGAREKILGANDAFFGTWEECLFVMPVFSKASPPVILVHLMVNCPRDPDDKVVRRLEKQYGWVLGYFQDVMRK